MVLESNTLDVLFVKDGQQGEDGKVLYTWIKYAKDANGTGMTDDPNGAVYIGISYNNESSTESNDPTQYAWTKIQGADGKKGEDAYTIFLENENISFATDENRNPLSEQAYTSGITIMKGAKPVADFTIGDIAKTQGIAVAKTDTAIAISVVNGNPLPNDSGEIEIPITVGGTVFKKILTWTCAKKGEQGEKGEQGIQGPQGEQGIAGKDGTSVTITNKSITYQLSTSGTTIPTGTWQTTPQAIPEGQYQWTKTFVTYSDGNKTESYSISYHGKNGSDGTSVKTTSTSVKYQVGDSGTTKPTGTWQSNVPTVAQGKYLWTQTIVNYSDGNSTESYSVSYRGIDGNNGVNGMNAATIYLYQRATSTPSKPSNTLTYTFSTTTITGTLNNGWSTAIPTGTDAVYVTVASVSSKNDTATIATSAWSAPVVLAQNGKTGSDGKAGLNVATIYLYQRNTSKPSKPSASVTYTFSTGVASGLNNGWSQKIPDGTNPLYVTLATASSNTATDTILSSEWSDVVVMAQNGEDGQDGISPKVSLSKSGNTTTISIVDATGTHTQTVKDGTNGTPGAAGKDGKTSYFHVKYSNDGGKTFTGNSGEDTGIYMGSYTDYTEVDSTDVKKYNWVKVKGDKGDTGQKGQDGTSIKITSKSVTYQTSTSGTTAPTGTWVTTVPTVANGQYLWTKTTVQYSDGNKTEAYSISYKGTNGTNGTSVTVSKTEVTYQVSTSGTTAPTGTWGTTMPSCDQGQYLWTKTYVKYSDGKDTTSYSVSYKGVDGEKFAFNMLRETNQGSKHWENHASGGKYSTKSIITEDGINAVKLICTEAIPSGGWQYVSFDDYQMLKSLKPSTDYVISFDIKSNLGTQGSWVSIQQGDSTNAMLPAAMAHIKGNETWEHIRVFLRSNDTLPKINGQYIYITSLGGVGYSIIKNLKLTESTTDTPWAPHPEDLEGRGVSETVQYYLATSQASGVTSSTSGWSTDITTQKLTADKKYLWNCYQTKYSDGTSEPISTPKVIGVYGDKGNGIVASVQRPNKTEFWWSQVGAVGHKDTFDDSSNTRNNCRVGDIFTVMGTSTEGNSHTVYYKSTTDSGDLAGECINHVIAESGADAKNLTITPSSQYFKSTDGGKTFAPDTITIKPTIQGEINFGKWQYSIDGGVSFADVVSGQKGLTISNNVLSVSKDSSLYSDAVTMVTFRAVANDSSFYDTCSIAKIYDVSDIQVGGRNLLWNSGTATAIQNSGEWNAHGCTATTETRNNCLVSRVNSEWNGYQFNLKKIIERYNLVDGDILTYSIDVKMDEPIGILFVNNYYADNKGCTGGISTVGQWDGKYFTIGKWERLSFTFKITQDTLDKIATDTYRQGVRTAFELIKATSVGKYVYFACPKLERGTKPTDWTPATEDVQTAILSTKSEISDVSLKVDKNKQAIEQRVEKTTYQQDLNLVKGDISKANEGLNKWRYEIYPKSLLTSEYQGKSTMDVFAKNTNLTPSQSVLINDTDLSIAWNYDNNYIGYALTFAKFSAAKSVAITFAHDDGAHIYLNGKLIGGSDAYSQTGESLTLGFVKGWNCIEVVVNEGANTEGFKLGTTISALSECQLMNCYYGTPVARQSHITNQLVQNTTDIDGVSGSVQKVMSTVGGSGKIDEFVNNYSTWKKKVDGIETRVGETYTTKSDFNGLEIGGRNLIIGSSKAEINSNWKQNGWAGSFTTYSAEERIYKLVASNGWHVARYTGLTEYAGQTITISFKAKNVKAETTASDRYDLLIANETGANPYTNSSLTSAKPTQDTWVAYRASMLLNSDGQIGIGTRCNPEGKGYKATWLIKDLKVEKGNKPTDWTPAQEDDEINGQNLVSNLPSNWEQGTVTEGSAIGTTYTNTKSSSAGSIRPKELIPVSGDITISIAYSNQSKKPIRHWIAAYDVNKNYLGNNYVSNAWNSFPRTLDMKDAKYIAIMVGYTDSSAITPSDISQICLKIERGTSATPFTLAPEDVNGKIVNVETIANQTAKKFEWIVKGGDSSSNLVLTDNALTAIANNINLTGKVTFNSFDQSLKDTINNKTNVSYLSLSSGGNNQACWKIATIKISDNYINQDIIIGVNHRNHGYTECRIQFKNAGNPDPGLASFRQTGRPSKCWRIIKTANSTWELYLYKTESWDDGNVVKYINPYHTTGNVSVTWSGENADLPSGTTTTEQMIADQTTIDGGIITTGYLSADRIAASSITADKIATDAIKSRNYISSGGTQGSFLNLSDGSFTSPNLSWDANGNLIAKNANLSGQITATDGSIGKFKITNQWLITGSGSTCAGLGGSGQAFWAGAENSTVAPFRVEYDGKLTSSNADITGIITATEGTVGGWHITKSGLYTNKPIIFEEEHDDGTIEEVFDEQFNAKVLYNSPTILNTFMFDKFCNTFVDTSTVQYDNNETLYTATKAMSTLIDQGCIDIHESMYCPDASGNHDWNYNYHLILTGNSIEFKEYTLDGMLYMPDEELTSIGVSYITTGLFACDQLQIGGENITSIIGSSDWEDCDYGNGMSSYADNTWNQVQVRKVNGIVFLRGIMQNNTTWQTHDSIFTFPKEYAPEKESRFVMQGSGSNRWLLVVRTNGVCRAERYSNNATMSNTVPLKQWLNVYASWPAK